MAPVSEGCRKLSMSAFAVLRSVVSDLFGEGVEGWPKSLVCLFRPSRIAPRYARQVGAHSCQDKAPVGRPGRRLGETLSFTEFSFCFDQQAPTIGAGVTGQSEGRSRTFSKGREHAQAP
jgi:hypothetical protein